MVFIVTNLRHMYMHVIVAKCLIHTVLQSIYSLYIIKSNVYVGNNLHAATQFHGQICNKSVNDIFHP